MLQHWLELEEELHNSFSIIAIHTGLRAYRLAYALNNHLGTRLKRSKEDLDLERQSKDFYFPLYEFENPRTFNKYDLVGNRSIRVGKSEGIIHYEQVQNSFHEIGYLIPEHKKVDYFLKLDFNDNCLSLDELINKINKISGVQSAYFLDNSLIKSINNLIFD